MALRRSHSCSNFRIFRILTATYVLCAKVAAGLSNGLALTPPMGYNTWNAFHDEINETLIYQAADELVETGLAAAGYVYLVIDGATLLLATPSPVAGREVLLHAIIEYQSS
jgi:hypothetical protein